MSDASNGGSNGNGGFLPPWLNVLLRIGVTAAIAVYLVYSLVNLEATDIRSIRDQLDKHSTQVDQLQTQFDEFYQRQEDYSGAILALMQRVCLNTANDGVERQACLQSTPIPPPQKKGGN